MTELHFTGTAHHEKSQIKSMGNWIKNISFIQR